MTSDPATEPPEKFAATKPAGGIGLGGGVGEGVVMGLGDGLVGVGDTPAVTLGLGCALGLGRAMGEPAHALTKSATQRTPTNFLIT